MQVCYETTQTTYDSKFKKLLSSGAAALNGGSVFAIAGMENLDKAGYQILEIIYDLGFWVIAIKCTYELIQGALKGDRRAVGNTIITYVLIYGALFFVPWVLRLVEGIF